jgi:site-specific DNA-methyltransferase (adenine-specific)
VKTYTVTLNNTDIEITQDDDGKFIKPTLVTSLESMGTAMKPAHEPCVLARKPIEGTVAANVLKHGTGGLNIDGSRVGTETLTAHSSGSNALMGGLNGSNNNGGAITPERTGRFPANLIHDGSDEVEAVFPQTKSSPRKVSNRRTNGTHEYGFGTDAYSPHNDSGSASRYFYCAKASKSERNAGLEGFEDIKLDIGDDRPSGSFNERFGHNEPRPTKNAHPTVKPLSLTKYLATLIKPPTGGRLLVPFSGSGSEMIGALQAGWEYVEGVELTEEYIPIAEARIKYWLEQKAEEDSKPKQSSLI